MLLTFKHKTSFPLPKILPLHYCFCFYLILLSGYDRVNAQCPTDLINISSQDALDKLSDKCTSLPRDLFISGQSIVSLKALKNVSAINGTLQISSTLLQSLEGLENLQFVEGGIQIVNNTNLTNVDALSGFAGNINNLTISGNTSLQTIILNDLKIIKADIEIQRNPKLTTVKIPSVSSARSFTINSCESLQVIEDMPFLENLDGKLYLEELPAIVSAGNFPKLKTAGDIYISRMKSLVNLSSISGVENVTGQITIEDNFALQNLSGLNQLKSINNIRVSRNPKLNYWGDWSSLESVTGTITINNNPELPDINGIGKFRTTNNLFITNNIKLSTLGGLKNLEMVNGNTLISDNTTLSNLFGLDNVKTFQGVISISSNYALSDLSHLEGLTTVGSLWIQDNIKLSTIAGLNNLQTCTSELHIQNNRELESIAALKNLKFIKNLYIEDNVKLASLEGLEGVLKADGIYVKGNKIQDLTGLNSLTTVEGTIEIYQNPYLTSLTGLDVLKIIKRNLIVSENISLVTMSGSPVLKEVGALLIEGNSKLTNLNGLKSIERIPGSLSVYNNILLASLSGLEQVDSTGNLYIQQSPRLADLKGLKGIVYIGGDLIISNDDIITNLEGLAGVRNIKGRLGIYGNYKLTSVSELETATLSGENEMNTPGLTIANNPLLSTCSMELICRYMYGHFSIIENNAVGCMNVGEVQSACQQTYPPSRLVSLGIPGECMQATGITIDDSNNNKWVDITDSEGYAIASIHAHGNKLGKVEASLYTQQGVLRSNSQQKAYLDRNITITPEIKILSSGNHVDVRLYFRKMEYEVLAKASEQSQNNQIKDVSDIGLGKTSDNICQKAMTANFTTLNSTSSTWNSDYMVTASISSFSTFFFTSKSANPLPVKLTSFKVRKERSQGIIDWETADEVNFSNFEIQRSENGITFNSIGRVESGGNKLHGKYSYIDYGLINSGVSTFYYRLKMLDLDGSYSFSSIAALHWSEAINDLFVYPNPSDDLLIVDAKSKKNLKWKIVNISGVTVMSGAPINDLFKIDIRKLTAGTYIIEFGADNPTIKFTKN